MTWVSKLHTEVMLSTMYAKYTWIIHSLRDLFKIKNSLKEVFGIFGFDYQNLNFTTDQQCIRKIKAQKL